MENKEFAEQLLDKLGRLEKRRPSEEVLQRMEEFAIQKKVAPKFNLRFLSGIAASLLLLGMLNIYAMSSTVQGTSGNMAASSTDAYDLLAIQTLYDE